MRRPGRLVAAVGALVALGACALKLPAGMSAAQLAQGSAALARTGSEALECYRLRDPVVSVQEEYAIGGAVAVRWLQDSTAGRGLLLGLEPVRGGGGPARPRYQVDRQARALTELTLYLNRVGKNLAAQSGRPTLPWTFGVIDSPRVNAYSSPGGYVLVTRGLLGRVRNEAQLAGVLAHEIAHVTERHALRTYAHVKSNQCAVALGARALAQAGDALGELVRRHGGAFREALRRGGFLDLDGSPALLRALGDQVVEDLTTRGFGAPDEYEADRLAAALLLSAGYDPRELVAFLGTLPEGEGGYRHHPAAPERQQRLSAWLQEQRERARSGEEFLPYSTDYEALAVLPFRGQMHAARE